MQKDLYEFVINELKAYKRNKAVLETLHNESSLGVSAQQLSEVPRSVTNKFSSMTENQAFQAAPDCEIKRDLKRVDIWLEYLTDEERYMVNNFYVEGRQYSIIIANWRTDYTARYWKGKRIQALNKICELILHSQSQR